MFNVGENIVHPTHGAGTIVDLQKQELVEGYQNYYVIRFADKRLTVRVPFKRIEDVGLRQVMGKSKCKEVLAVLRDLPQVLPNDFKARRKAVEKMIQSGRPIKIAEAVRELTWRREIKRLNKADSELFSQARELLVQEMSLAMELQREAILQQIDTALNQSVEAQNRVLEEESEKEEADEKTNKKKAKP